MRFVRSLAVGAVAIGATAGLGVLGAGSASALGVTPLPGGVQVDMNHDETVWAHQNKVGAVVAGLPSAAAKSFGTTLDAATELSQTYPKGRVSFSAFGPITDPSGVIVAFEE
ncbi:hypothetical protein [Antrihabitans cavernicola]|uniref:Uncharacterized protein n=1 Tax=Antrihabitans cavernicola TaxID=2495913 RepID=A0A5A7SD03_9NOCA|nr:hypothetical protein [Spelaeibacter cavernicola]KAA0023062.1 hypothetical protein FOY51_11285 [Spelaeibacter cavernicola]